MERANFGFFTHGRGAAVTRRDVIKRGAFTAASLGLIGVVGCSSSNNSSSNAANNAGAAKPTTQGAATGATSAAARATGAAATSNAGSIRSTIATVEPEPAGVKRGGRIQWPTSDPFGNMDPYRDAGTGLFTIQTVYNGLLRMQILPNQGVTVYPDLADSFERPDPTTVVFHLHPGVTWQNVAPTNGRAFVANDVKLAYERMASKSPGFTLAPFLSFVSSIDTPDPNTVSFKMSSPYGPFINMVADTWHVLEPPELLMADDAKAKDVGTGPFIVTKYEPGVQFTMDANKNYFKQGKPYVAGIDWALNLGDPAAAQAAFFSKKSDIASISYAVQDDYKSKVPDAVFQPSPYGPYNIEINCSRAPLNDVRVRNAIQLAVDNNLITQIGYQGHANPGQPYGSVLSQYQLPASELPKRDVQKAKQLLAAAGQPNLTIENWLPTTVVDNGPEQIRTSLAEAGITMKYKQTDFGTWRVGAYTNGDMDVTSTASFVYPNPDMQLWIKYHTGAGNNNMHFSDPQLDKMLEDARGELDTNRAVQLYQNASRYLIQQNPSVYTVEPINLFATQARLKNMMVGIGANTTFLYFKRADGLYLDPPS